MWGGQGSHNKPTGCGASGAYAPCPDKEEEEEEYIYIYVSTMRNCALCASGSAHGPPLVAKTTMKFGFPQRQNILRLTEQT